MAQSMEVDKRELTEALNKFIATSDKLAHMRDNTSSSTITVTGATGWQVTACLLMAVLGMAFGAFGLYMAADARSEMRANNTNRERDIGELRQTDNAIRAYINTGVLKPKGSK